MKKINLMGGARADNMKCCLSFLMLLSLAQFAHSNPAVTTTTPAVTAPIKAQAAMPVVAPEDRILVQAWAETETVISSPIVGLIQRIPSHVGQRFGKGEAVVLFDCTENMAKAEIAQSELAAASEALEAKIRLKSMDAASEIEVTTAAAQVSKAEAQLKLAKYQVSQCKLPSPFEGYVVRIMGKPYQNATVGQPLLEMISVGVPKLRVSASSKLFTKVKVGTLLKVTIDETGLSYTASVSSINARIDPVNQNFEMEARVRGSGVNLLAGMSGTAVVVDAELSVRRGH